MFADWEVDEMPDVGLALYRNKGNSFEKPIYVFTEAEAKAFAKYWVDWRGCYDDNSLTGHIYACFEIECKQMLKGAK